MCLLDRSSGSRQRVITALYLSVGLFVCLRDSTVRRERQRTAAPGHALTHTRRHIRVVRACDPAERDHLSEAFAPGSRRSRPARIRFRIVSGSSESRQCLAPSQSSSGSFASHSAPGESGSRDLALRGPGISRDRCTVLEVAKYTHAHTHTHTRCWPDIGLRDGRVPDTWIVLPKALYR